MTARGPGRSARTQYGELAELPGGWGFFELDLDALGAAGPDVVAYADVITFPAVKQDLAFSVDESVAAGDLIAAAREAAGPELHDLRVFDVYRGEQVGEGKKSVALAASVSVAGAHALRRGRGDACASGSSPRSPSASAPSSAPEQPRPTRQMCAREVCNAFLKT